MCERRMLCVPHVAPFFFLIDLFIYLIRVQTGRTWTGCSPACVRPLKPITADGSCGAGWLAGRGRTEAGGRSVAQLAAEDPQPLSRCLLRRGQWDKRPLQITRDEQRRRFYWTSRRFFTFFCLKFIWVKELKEHAPKNKQKKSLTCSLLQLYLQTG